MDQQWKPGDIANGHVLGGDGVWRPVAAPPTTPARAAPVRYSNIRVFVMLLAAFAVAGAALVVYNTITKPAGSTPSGGSYRSVAYMVTGSTLSADLTYVTPDGIAQKSKVAIPMASPIVFSMPRGAFVSLSAQNQLESGSVTCTITADGVVMSENTSTGAFVIASCDGRVS